MWADAEKVDKVHPWVSNHLRLKRGAGRTKLQGPEGPRDARRIRCRRCPSGKETRLSRLYSEPTRYLEICRRLILAATTAASYSKP